MFYYRSVLEDPPSISEGCGGRVTDYRITDFGLLMKQNLLLPIKSNSLEKDVTPIAEMKSRINRMTRYWPLTISSTLIFNLKQVGATLTLLLLFSFLHLILDNLHQYIFRKIKDKKNIDYSKWWAGRFYDITMIYIDTSLEYQSKLNHMCINLSVM